MDVQATLCSSSRSRGGMVHMSARAKGSSKRDEQPYEGSLKRYHRRLGRCDAAQL